MRPDLQHSDKLLNQGIWRKSMSRHSLDSLPPSCNLYFKLILPLNCQSSFHSHICMKGHAHTSHSTEISPGLCSIELTPELASPAHYCLSWTNLISSLPVLNLWQKVPALGGHVGSAETQKSQSGCSDRNSEPRDPAQSAANTPQLSMINNKHTTIDWHQPGNQRQLHGPVHQGITTIKYY